MPAGAGGGPGPERLPKLLHRRGDGRRGRYRQRRGHGKSGGRLRHRRHGAGGGRRYREIRAARMEERPAERHGPRGGRIARRPGAAMADPPRVARRQRTRRHPGRTRYRYPPGPLPRGAVHGRAGRRARPRLHQHDLPATRRAMEVGGGRALGGALERAAIGLRGKRQPGIPLQRVEGFSATLQSSRPWPARE
ncbi:hypothetical protein G6F31_018305 [Rhizopus arrhizus]|nr:hypothetical protein G6F31_018305 [Rhizopus arrhizus]